MNQRTISYFLACSIVFNAVLIAFVIGPLYLLLFLLAATNIISLWYIRTLMKKIDNFNSDLARIFNSVESFSDILNSVYSMEIFYGEPVLEQLIKNSNNLLNELIDYQEKYSLDVVEIATEAEIEEIEEEDVYGEEEEE
tara:strand:+ start:250 stop:666 length:417 start_codon:yes stop_codon:yes gene_type:complete